MIQAKALVFREANKPLLEEVEIPNLTANEIRVKTMYSGVSIGTESSIFSGVRTNNGTFPLVGGYMSSGVIQEIGLSVKGFATGDQVIVNGSRLQGKVNSVWGAHMSIRIADASTVVKVPEKVKMQEAAMFILPNVGLNAVSMAGINEQDTVLIFGQGLIGQFFGQFAKNRGARIIAVEPNKIRSNLSRQYVTDFILDPFKDDIETEVERITCGKGPSVVVEATASSKVLNTATRFLQRNGKMVFLSWYPGSISLNFADFHNNKIVAYFPMGAGNKETTHATLKCLSDGSLIFGKNITDLIKYQNACEGYLRIIGGDKTIMGMVIDWRNA